MNPRIRWVGFVLLACFIVLFVQLNNIQVRQAAKLSRNPLGQTSGAGAIYLPRGAILSADNKVLAYSVKSPVGQQRIYPPATAVNFGQITGAVDTTADAIEFGVEEEYNKYLAQHESAVNSLSSLVTQHEETDDVVLTIPTTLQADAAYLASQQKGAEIVALNPQTGAVLAMYGSPSYDPNSLASLKDGGKAAAAAFKSLASQNPEPFLSLASSFTHAPGSTFKTMTTAAIFDHDPSLASKVWPEQESINIPQSSTPFHNFGYGTCGGPLAQILAASCDTAYAEVGLALGASSVTQEAHAFGWCQGISGDCKAFGGRPPLDLPAADVAGATMAPESVLAANPPFLAYSAIGQYEDQASALSMALVASGFADNGRIMAPHVMSKVIDDSGNVVEQYKPHIWRKATTPQTAQKVRSLMLGPTEDPDGTAYGVFSNLQSEGIQVAAKTGTAEVTEGACATNDWMIAMAPAGPGQTPKAVVAVEVPTPNGTSDCNEKTGAIVAGPVIDRMLTDVLNSGQ